MQQRFRNFHEGEAAIQAESGVDTATFDRMVDQAFRPELADNEARFVAARTFSVAASVDDRGRPWASPLLGQPGQLFAVEDPATVLIRPPEVAGDPLLANVAATGELGILYIDPSRRRRAKSLGQASIGADGRIRYRMHRNFGLCTKYIARRDHHVVPGSARPDRPDPSVDAAEARAASTAAALGPADREALAATDTIFLASHHVDHGADATHRGGHPGFVTVVDPMTIQIPDYLGNGMFQTLGNLLLDDRIGLLSLDFQTGRSLQLTGRGQITAAADDDPLASRVLRISVDEVRISWPDVGRWSEAEAFPVEPGLRNPATPYR